MGLLLQKGEIGRRISRHFFKGFKTVTQGMEEYNKWGLEVYIEKAESMCYGVKTQDNDSDGGWKSKNYEVYEY